MVAFGCSVAVGWGTWSGGGDEEIRISQHSLVLNNKNLTKYSLRKEKQGRKEKKKEEKRREEEKKEKKMEFVSPDN